MIIVLGNDYRLEMIIVLGNDYRLGNDYSIRK